MAQRERRSRDYAHAVATDKNEGKFVDQARQSDKKHSDENLFWPIVRLKLNTYQPCVNYVLCSAE